MDGDILYLFKHGISFIGFKPPLIAQEFYDSIKKPMIKIFIVANFP